MDGSGQNTMNFLDSYRYTKGTKQFINYFKDLAKTDVQRLLQYINEDNLRFSSLYLLHPDIMESNLYTQLSARNQKALEITQRILAKETSGRSSSASGEEAVPASVLRWMLESGHPEDGLDSRYDRMLDMTAILLVKVHKDKSVLPMVADMMFNRYRKGEFIYDLVWAFFESRDPNGLLLIANRLCSAHWKDIELARKLLGFVPGFGTDTRINPVQQYSYFFQWLHENSPFLYFTGEGFQQTSHPIPYQVLLEAKYLCKRLSKGSNVQLRSVTDSEAQLLEQFGKLSPYLQNQLANYSYWLYRHTPYEWKIWLRSSIAEQLNAVSKATGGVL